MTGDVNIPLQPLSAEEQELVEQAQQLLRRAYQPDRHTVAAAARGSSGRIHLGVNIEACGYGPCAEPVALGAAVTHGEATLSAIVAVAYRVTPDAFIVLPPCGNCRQMLLDYAGHCRVILPTPEGLRTAAACDLLPLPYRNHAD